MVISPEEMSSGSNVINKLSGLFEYVPNFLPGKISDYDSFLKGLSSELTSVLDVKSAKVTDCIILKDQLMLPNLPSTHMDNFPFITKLCDNINNSGLCKGSVNGCVVNHYPHNIMRTNPHADNENYTDQSTSISTFSVGGTRRFRIYKNGVLNPQLTFDLEQSSLMIMHPGSQRITKHHLISDPNYGNMQRWSISFRRFVPAFINKNQWPYNHTPSSTNAGGSSFQQQQPHINVKSSTTEPHTSQTPTLALYDQITNLVANADLETCKKVLVLASNRIKDMEIQMKSIPMTETEIDSLISFIPDLLDNPSQPHDISVSGALVEDNKSNSVKISEEELTSGIEEDLNALGLDVDGQSDKQKNDDISTVWLLNNPNEAPFLDGRDMNEFPNILHLQKLINSHDQCIGTMNSCLISFYPNGNSASRKHSDNQSYICNSSSICNFSLGDPRKISFFSKLSHTSPPVKSFNLDNKSLLVMQPHCQLKLEHMIYWNASTSGRYCLSFRKVVPLNNLSKANINDLNPDQLINAPPTNKEISVIFGTSITTRINPDKLVGKYRKTTSEVINLSKSGAKLQDISNYVDKFYAGTLDELKDRNDKHDMNIKNIILSFGTNDIRFKKNGVHMLYLPLQSLITKTRQLFPDAKIFIQACIPIKLEKSWTAPNVLNFNKLLR